MRIACIYKYLLLLLTAIIAAVATGYAQPHSPSKANADGFFLQGIVRDSITGEALPRSSVITAGTKRAVVSDDRGIFAIPMSREDHAIRVSCIGYVTREVPIVRDQFNLAVVYLQPARLQLDELVVNRKKYSKRDNPALDFAKRLRNTRHVGDPHRNDYYTYDKYEKITLAINDFDPNADNALLRRYPFLSEYVDTSEVSGKPILNLSVKEKASTVTYRRDPHSEKTIIRGFKTTGIDQVGNTDNVQVFLEDILREVNLYDNDITLLDNRFVSPLSPIAPDFYKFYLTDTISIASDSCAVLSFYPFNRTGFGFTGHIYVVLNDSAMTVRKVDMSIPREINLNFINKFYLSQTYDTAPDGSRLKTSDDLTLEVAPTKGMQALYLRRNTLYGNHSFDEPEDLAVFDRLGKEFEVDSVESRSEDFWQEARFVNLTRQESEIGNMFDRLSQSKLFYYGSRAFSAMVQGYVPVGPKFDYGPLNTTVSFNPIEGTRFRAGGMTTAGLSKRWFGRGFVAYGVKDHRWKYRAEAEYSFHDKKRHSREFPVHSLRLSSSYDIDYIGQHYMFTNYDNVFLSLKRMVDRNVIYQRIIDLKYSLELRNNFSLYLTAANNRQIDSPWVPFVNGYGQQLGHYTQNQFTLQLRYAPGEKFVQTRSNRIPVNLDAPIISLTQTFAPKALSQFALNRTELSLQKRFWLSAFGYADFMVLGAKVWSRSSFIDLIIPNANLSYTIQPESFALLNPMEFINDSQVSWFFNYCPNGLIFNNIPLLKRAQLRESVSFNGFYGRLSDHNNPANNPDLLRIPTNITSTRMTKGPYMEIAAGIDNIFHCLRVDYVWRLTYRQPPYQIDRSGLRIALHVMF